MPDPEGKKKKRRTVLEGFNNVPKLLKEARQAVDEVTQGVQDQGVGETHAATQNRQTGSKRQPAVTRKTSARKTSPPPRASRSPAKAAAPAIPLAADSSGQPKLRLRDCGIKVKHAIPGRIRLRLYKMLYNEALAAELPALLAAVPGITSVEASSATGSLLITFNPGGLAVVKARQNLDGVMHRFFPEIDTESLVRRMLGE